MSALQNISIFFRALRDANLAVQRRIIVLGVISHWSLGFAQAAPAASVKTDASAPTSSSPTPIDVASEAAPVVGEEVIVVTGARKPEPQRTAVVATDVIDRELMESRGGQVADSLAGRPGLWIERGVAGTNGITIQGLGPKYTLILVDGARQIGRTDGTLDLDRFSVNDLEQIEVVKGPSSAMYGADALGGVVNLVTRKPRPGFSGDMLARFDGRRGYQGRARVAFGGAKLGGSLSGSHRAAPALRLENDGNVIATSFDQLVDDETRAQAVYQPSSRWRLQGASTYNKRDLRGVVSSATGAIFDRRNLTEAGSGTVRGQLTAARTTLLLAFGASQYRDQYVNNQRMSDALDQYQRTDESLIETSTQLAHRRGQHSLMVGGEVLRERLASPRLLRAGYRQRTAFFLQDSWRPITGQEVTVVPALRFDTDTQFGSRFTPRLGAQWLVTPALVGRASLGTGYRAPSFKELLLQFENSGAGYVVEGNRDLRPESAVNVQGSVGYQHRGVSVSAEAFLNRLRDMISFTSQPDDGSGTLRFSYGNIGRARTGGMELSAQVSRGRAAAELGYALTLSRDFDAGRALEGVPQHRVAATVRWFDKAQGFEGFATAIITGPRPLYLSADAMVATNTPTRVDVSGRMAKRFSAGYGAFVGVDNLLNAGDLKLDRILPRTLYAGMDARW